MADLQIVAQATHVPSTLSTTRTITIPGGVFPGDTVHIFATVPGSSTLTMTGGTGFTTETPITGSGVSSHYIHKRDASPSDSNVTLTFTTTNAVRVSIIIVVTRGQKASVAPAISKTAVAYANSRVLSSVTAGARSGYLAFLSITGDLSNMTGISASPAMTSVAQVLDKTGGGGSAASALWSGGPVASGASYGGNTLSVAGSSGNAAAWLVGLELQDEVVEDTVYPSSTVSSTGWTAVGAATIHAALADSNDSTYAESGDNPAGSTIIVALPALDDGDITVRTRNSATAATPTITRQIALMQGITVVATRSVVLTTAVTQHSFTLTTEELALVTDRTSLRVRIIDTAA